MVLLFIAGFCFSTGHAYETPILSIDTGGHMATIKDMKFTRDGRYIISAANDKTVRVWDLETGEIARVIRGQIGPGTEGKFYGADLSPDNRYLALGGWFDDARAHVPCCGDIRLIDFQSGEIIRLLQGHTSVIDAVAFSDDSRRLISASKDLTARIWDVETGTTLHTLSGHGDDIYAVAFSPDGKRAATGSNDDVIRLWDARTGKLIRELTGHTGDVRSLVFTPDGRYLVSGSKDKTIRLWDGRTGAFIKELAKQGSFVSHLSVAPDGRSVLTGHSCTFDAIEYINNVFSIPDGRKLVSFSMHDNIALATAISPDGSLAATGGGDNEIYVWDIHTGKVKQKFVGKGQIAWSVGFAKDGKTIAWGKTFSREDDALYQVRGRLEQSFRLSEAVGEYRLSLGNPIDRDTDYIRAVESAGGVSIRTRNGKVHPTLDIRKNGTLKHEITRDRGNFYCQTLTPDGKTIIAGTSWDLLAFDSETGKELREFIGHTGVVWGLAVSPDGKWVVSGAADQTVKLWDIDSGKNLLTIFHGTDNEWVAWTPEGYYDSSVKGDQYIGWHLNRGKDRSALYYSASQFADKFRKPLVAGAYLETNGNLERALLLAEKRKPGRQRFDKTDSDDIATLLPPKVFFISPQSDMLTSDGQVCIKAGAESLTDAPVTDIWLVLNGRQTRSIKRKNKSLEPVKKLSGAKAFLDECFQLEDGQNQIALFAATQDATSPPQTLRVTRKLKGKKEDDLFKPNLYLLSIGVSRYANSSYNLKVAHRDAEAVVSSFSAQKGRLYRDVHAKLLTDQQATADNILDGLDWILRQSTQRDVSVIFVAGHGENDDAQNYYFIPHDGNLDRMRRTCVKWFDFQDVVSRLPSKTLMMVDTCRSGNITGSRRSGASDITEALRELMKASPGLVVMAASTGREASIEKAEWGHGAFTKALVEGLKEFRADYNRNGSLEIKELDLYVTERVKQLTDGRQHATTEIPKIMPNFPIAVK